jgi:hypothetical protein
VTGVQTCALPILGAAALFPRQLYVAGQQAPGCVFGDFCIHPRHRSLGLALQLQRTCLKEVDSELYTAAYDFPSTAMTAVYRRLGAEPQQRMVRLAKPLRLDRKIGQNLRARALSRPLSAIGNRVLKWRDRHSFRRREGISHHQGLCGEEFSELAARLQEKQGICVARTAEYLNWRFVQHPSQRFEIFTARRRGELFAYMIFTQTQDDARIVDLFGIDDTEVLGRLVKEAVEFLRDRGVITVSAPVLASHPRVALFESLGFRSRESCPVLIYSASRSLRSGRSGAEPQWFLMEGDRDS